MMYGNRFLQHFMRMMPTGLFKETSEETEEPYGGYARFPSPLCGEGKAMQKFIGFAFVKILFPLFLRINSSFGVIEQVC